MSQTQEEPTTLSPSVTVGKHTYSRRTYSLIVIAIAFLSWTFVSIDGTIPNIAAPDLIKQFGVTTSYYLYLSSGLFAIAIVGQAVVSRYTDRFGRKPLLQISLIGTSVFGAVTAAVGTVWQFVLIRVGAATSQSTEPVVNTYVSENVAPRFRGLAMGFVQAGFPLGVAIAGDIGAYMLPRVSWRYLFLISFIPALLCILVLRFLKESERHEASRLVQQREGVSRRHGWRTLWQKGLGRQTILLGAYGTCINGGIGLVNGVAIIYMVFVDHLTPGHASAILADSNWAALAGQLLVGFLADYIPSRLLLGIWAVLGAGFMALFGIPRADTTLIIISLVGFGFFGNGTFGCYLRYASECYPTELRGTGLGFVAAGSTLTFLFMPIVGANLISTTHANLIPIIAAVVVALGAVVIAFCRHIPPRRQLEQTSPALLISQSEVSQILTEGKSADPPSL